MRAPPLLPTEALRRVLRLSRFDGMMVLTVAGAFAVASALSHDQVGTEIGLAVAGAGAVELHGFGLLRQRRAEGMRWLVGSQLLLMAVILGYSFLRLAQIDPAVMQWMSRAVITDQVRAALADKGLSVNAFLHFYYQACYFVLALLTIAYQGGMAYYYRRRTPSVAAALTEAE